MHKIIPEEQSVHNEIYANGYYFVRIRENMAYSLKNKNELLNFLCTCFLFFGQKKRQNLTNSSGKLDNGVVYIIFMVYHWFNGFSLYSKHSMRHLPVMLSRIASNL